MKKIKLLIAAVAMVGLAYSSVASADGFAPGEGLYIGGFGAHGMGVVQPKVTTAGNTAASAYVSAVHVIPTNNNKHEGGTWQTDDGGLALEGFEGGGQIGYGYKMGDLYVGLEGEYAGSDVEFKLTSDTAVTGVGANKDGETGITEITAKKEWTGGLFGRIGYYVNQDTLLAFRGGVLVSEFDVAWGTAITESYHSGGPSLGLDLSSRITAVDPNLSVRVGAVYTDFMTAPISGIGTLVGQSAQSGHDSEVTGSALSARVGLQYSFFDVNSLF